jgi:hypothetical protein
MGQTQEEIDQRAAERYAAAATEVAGGVEVPIVDTVLTEDLDGDEAYGTVEEEATDEEKEAAQED